MTDYKNLQLRAHYLVKLAILRGDLERRDYCELCGETGGEHARIKVTANGYRHLWTEKVRIVAHHYSGYEGDNSLKVWWLCYRCNAALRGPQFHNGSLTLEQARQLVLANEII